MRGNQTKSNQYWSTRILFTAPRYTYPKHKKTSKLS